MSLRHTAACRSASTSKAKAVDIVTSDIIIIKKKQDGQGTLHLKSFMNRNFIDCNTAETTCSFAKLLLAAYQSDFES